MQLHNLGYLRMAVEDALVAYIAQNVSIADVRPAYTTERMETPRVTVHAESTRQMDDETYRLARYVECSVRCLTYATPGDNGHDDDTLRTAREHHHDLVASVTHALVQSDVLTLIADMDHPRVDIWSLFVTGDAGGTMDDYYVTTIAVEIGATPAGVVELEAAE